MTRASVSPTSILPTHKFSLANGTTEMGFKLENGVSSFIEVPQTPSTLNMTGGGTKFGDWDPTFSHIERRSWIGGRGSDDFSTDPTRFFDSQAAFTMLPSFIVPAPQWKLATGLRTALQNMPGSVNWQALTASDRYVSHIFTVGGSNMGADNASVWIRRIGSPGTLTCEIWSDSAGEPNAIVTSATDTVTTSTIADVISEWYTFDESAASDLTSSTAYHIVLYSASTDNKANHWEVGVDTSTTNSYSSADGSTWAASSFSLYYRVADADTGRRLRMFELEGLAYAVDILDSGGASTLYMNGERGKATGGTSTTLVDTDDGMDGSWADDQWNGYYIRIIGGTGKGTSRRLISDTTAAGTITVSSAFDITPDNTSVYIVYGGPAWQSFASGTTGLGAVKDVAVLNNSAYFAQGSGDNIRRIHFDDAAGTPIHVYADDSTNKADVLLAFPNAVDGPQMWRGENDTVDVSRATAVAKASNLTFGTEIAVADDNYDIQNITEHDRQVIVWKADGRYQVVNDRVEKAPTGLDFIKSDNNGQAAISHKNFLYFSWGDFTIQRLYGADLSSVGYDVGIGLPSNRKGSCTFLASHPAGLFAVNDAGTLGISSVMFRDDSLQSWHEVFRSPKAGWRVREIFWQDNEGTNPIMWIECNGELYYQTWPYLTFNPAEDSSIAYQHESVIVDADVDMGVANLTKYIKELNLVSENLTTGIEARFEYQINKDIGTSTWTSAETFMVSPTQSLLVNAGEVYKIRTRLRMLTNVATTPPKLYGTVLEGFSRTPFKRQWTFRVKVSDFQVVDNIGTPDFKPDDVLRFLQEAAQKTTRLILRSGFVMMHDIFVVVDPPTVTRTSLNNQLRAWAGILEFTVREA